MLSNQEFENWCTDLNLPRATGKVIEQIRLSSPTRRVSGSRGNVAGRYPSRKMGVTIQFESHRNELAAIYEMEHDEAVLEYYDQPPAIKLNYSSKQGRQLSVDHTPDFFVLHTNGASWEECKTNAELSNLVKNSPNRYQQCEDRQWYCPPGEDYAQSLGLGYRIRLDTEIDWIYQRNLIFLEDYFRGESLSVTEKIASSVLAIASSEPGITLVEVFNRVEAATADDIYLLIATAQVYVNLSAALLVEPEHVQVYLDQSAALAAPKQFFRSHDVVSTLPVVEVAIGASLSWDGNCWTILNVGTKKIVLCTELDEWIALKTTQFEDLVRQGEITSLDSPTASSISPAVQEHYLRASPEVLTEANRRYKAIQPYLQASPSTAPTRTEQRWLAQFLAARQKYGSGYVGLLPNHQAKGNRVPRLNVAVLELMNQSIVQEYETLTQKRRREVYGSFVLACEKAGITDIPSYQTFCKKVKQRSGYEQTLRRQGPRAAYQHLPFYWELEKTTPQHGDRPFEIAHIDHTELDVELLCSRTNRLLGRPWGTFLTDAFSRRLLAIYLTFDPPSYRSCMMVLRVCVQRFARLPQIIVVDNGAEFNSTYFETLLASFECTKKSRPSAQPRFGSVCERLFGTSNTQFIYNLSGNTQITQNVRCVVKSINPKQHAIWTLGQLYESLCEWAYEIYDKTEHPALGQSPQEAFVTGLAQGGFRTHRLIRYDEHFRILTLPTTSRGKAKVQPGMGVKLNYIYYWCNAFRNPEVEKSWVDVRYDPFNAGVAYAFVDSQWVECISQHYAAFKGRSEKEIRLASAEIHKRKQNHSEQSNVSAKRLAEFLACVEAQETLLTQRLRDTEAKDVIAVIDRVVAPSKIPVSRPVEDELSDQINTTTAMKELLNTQLPDQDMKFQFLEEW